VGLRFQNVPKSSQELLEKWLREQMGQVAGANQELAGADSETIP
jgi:hypothetical protein